jgi:hypothetical protein
MLTHPGATDAHLTLWAFEDWLKKYFYTLLQVLEVRNGVTCSLLISLALDTHFTDASDYFILLDRPSPTTPSLLFEPKPSTSSSSC